MNSTTFHLPIGELGGAPSPLQRKVLPSDCLHYCPPSAGGWGILRVGLLIPESVLLFVSPAGCGRHGSIAAIQIGYKRRLYLLQLEEMDVVTGRHMTKIPQAVREVLAFARPRPKAFVICASCIDDLLGSDYEGLAQELEDEHKIPVRLCHMDPIAVDGKAPPQFTVQKAVYDFLEPAGDRDQAVNIIGSFAPLDAESEFYEVMADVGIGKVRHVASCATLAEFQQMSRSTHNLLIKPAGRLAAQRMEKKLGIPYCFAPVAYSLEVITENYRDLGKVLGVQLSTDRYRAEVEQAVQSYRRMLGPLSVAVGSTANASPFELARALTEYDFEVRYVFADMILDFERKHVLWLKQHAPHVQVFTNAHPTMAKALNGALSADVALGFDAGYFCPGAKTVPLSLDRQLYGYRGVIGLLRQIAEGVTDPRSHRELMYASGLVI